MSGAAWAVTGEEAACVAVLLSLAAGARRDVARARRAFVLSPSLRASDVYRDAVRRARWHLASVRLRRHEAAGAGGGR